MANITGTSQAETIAGTSSSDTINALDGNDIVNAGDGNDRVFGGNGNDTLNGGNGNDRLYGESGDDILNGGDGNDRLYGGDDNDVLSGGTGSDDLDGGAGIDTADYSSASSGVTLAFTNMDVNGIGGQFGNASAGGFGGEANGDTFNSIERFIGSNFQDYIGGGSVDMTFNLGAGNDVFDTNAAYNAVDTVDGGAGNDTIWGGGGNDILSGGADNDVLYGENDHDTLDGGLGNDRLYGGSGNDTLKASAGSDQLYGDSGNDTVIFNKTTAAGGTTTADGGSGTDTLRVELTTAELTNAVRSDLLAYQAFLANPSSAGIPFAFSTLGLTATNFETLQLVIDGIVSPVTPPNAPPVVDAGNSTSSLSVAHNGSANGQITATDTNGDTLTYSVQTGPQNGTVSINAATGAYTFSAGDFVGADSFTLQVSDGQGGTTTHTVTVDLTNDGPAINPASTEQLTVGHGDTVTGQISATDADGDNLTYSVQTGPQNGTISIDPVTGAYTYAAGDYVGSDTFELAVSDGHGGVTTRVVNVTLTNEAPVVTAGSTASIIAHHGESASGVIGGTDADGDGVSYSVLGGPAHGSVSIDAQTGAFTFTADARYAGTDSFSLQVSDGHGGFASHTVDVGVWGVLDQTAGGTGINVDLMTDIGTGFTAEQLRWIIDVDGTAYNDVIKGDIQANVFNGFGGKDELRGLGGNDTLDGGIDDDKLFGDDGNDLLIGGDGNDVLNGGAHDDRLIGGIGNDGFFGGGGNDLIEGGEGNDRLYGDGANDVLIGGTGNDIMTGAGINNGGHKGANTYVWSLGDVVTAVGGSNGLDHITDFGAGDRLDFSDVFDGSSSAAAYDMLQVTDTAAGLVISAEVGSGGALIDIVVLDNVHGLSLDDLFTLDQIVV